MSHTIQHQKQGYQKPGGGGVQYKINEGIFLYFHFENNYVKSAK